MGGADGGINDFVWSTKMRYSGTTTERLDRIERGVKAILNNVGSLFKGEVIIMTQLTDTLDEIEKNAEADRDADAAAKNLIVKLGKMIVDATAGGATPEAIGRLKAIGQGMVDRAADLSAAVVAGTPAEEPPTGGSTGNFPA